MQDLGYTPNRIARSLVSKRSYTLGLLISDISNPFYPPFILGAESKAHSLKYSILLGNANTYATAVENLNMLLEKQVDGIIVTSLEFKGEDDSNRGEKIGEFNEYLLSLSESLAERGVPLCVVNYKIASDTISSVMSDNLVAAKLAAEHLIERGHRRIAFVCHEGANEKDDTLVNIWALRLQGFLSVMKKHRLEVPENYLYFWPDDSMDGGYQCARRILALSERPTAIFAANDIYAIGILDALYEAHYRVPDDISVIGIDGLDVTRYLSPQLTTISLESRKLGEAAVEQFFQAVEGDAGPRDIVLKPKFLAGRSVGDAPKSP
jgi:DNA-binding LacI/PurR family transcriptional regulator